LRVSESGLLSIDVHRWRLRVPVDCADTTALTEVSFESADLCVKFANQPETRVRLKLVHDDMQVRGCNLIVFISQKHVQKYERVETEFVKLSTALRRAMGLYAVVRKQHLVSTKL
jgi:hypothetical protein